MNLKYLLKPVSRHGIVRDSCLMPIAPEEYSPPLGFDDVLQESRTKIASFRDHPPTEGIWKTLFEQPDEVSPTLTFLGTGCAMPSKYRNVTCNHFQPQPGVGILLDSGEGTFGQMCRRWGLKGAEEKLRELRLIWISHLHADHHLGLLRVLSERTKLSLESEQPLPPVLVVGPVMMGWWLEDFAANSHDPIQYQFLDNDHFLFTNGRLVSQAQSKAAASLPEVYQRTLRQLRECGITSLKTAFVEHCPFSYGVVLEHQTGWKLVYSGDAKPTPDLVTVGRGATALIHEVSFSLLSTAVPTLPSQPSFFFFLFFLLSVRRRLKMICKRRRLGKTTPRPRRPSRWVWRWA